MLPGVISSAEGLDMLALVNLLLVGDDPNYQLSFFFFFGWMPGSSTQTWSRFG